MKKSYIVTCGVAAVLAFVLIAPLAVRVVTGGFFMTVRSESMMPTYLVGDVLLVVPEDPSALHAGDVVVARLTEEDDALYVHRVLGHAGGTWTLRGDRNVHHTPIDVTCHQIAGVPALRLTGVLGELFTSTQNVFGRIYMAALILGLVTWPTIRAWCGGGNTADTGSATTSPVQQAS